MRHSINIPEWQMGILTNAKPVARKTTMITGGVNVSITRNMIASVGAEAIINIVSQEQATATGYPNNLALFAVTQGT